ncbi:MAG: exo-alpha-sialidase [Candidatus Hydrogenedentes bacterium]|nr:exo-alpha-sialidase [Candidatus Hydrogenedentota bacterium]
MVKRTFRTILAVFWIGFVPAAWCQARNLGPEPSPVDVFIAGQGGYHTYRIPVLIASKSGTLLAFCEGRKNSASDRGDIDLLLKRSFNRGKSWQETQLIHEEGGDAEITIGNPCPVVDESTGIIWLAFTRNNERAFVTQSADDGATWSAPREITESLRSFPFPWTRIGTGPVNGIQLGSGRMVLPIWLNETIDKVYRSACIISDDHGATWHPGGLIPDRVPNANECTVAEVEPGVLCINLRNKNEPKRRAVSWSRDGGVTWSDPVLDPALIDPVCQGSLVAAKYKGKPCLLFSNAASVKRERLTVRASLDNGNQWSEGVVLHAGPAGYSSLAIVDRRRVGCLFEAGMTKYKEKIVFMSLPIKKVVNAASAAPIKKAGVVLTFDDAHVAEWVSAMPLFEKYGAHATFFVTQFDKLTEDQVAGLRRLQEAGHAIGCHGLRHRKAVDYVRDHSAEQYLVDEIIPAVNLMVGSGFRPTAFAYPNSQSNDATDAALIRVFRHLRTGSSLREGQRLAECDALFTPIGDVEKRGCLNGRGIDHAGEADKQGLPDEIREALKRAKKRNEVLVLYAHSIGGDAKNHISREALEGVLKDTHERGLQFYTYDQLP